MYISIVQHVCVAAAECRPQSTGEERAVPLVPQMAVSMAELHQLHLTRSVCVGMNVRACTCSCVCGVVLISAPCSVILISASLSCNSN